ncbi:hypothetical protein [Mesomycoplasma bovoculi]|uniref:Putative lipoprotein n=1 Tax=Mesomycoplasma bovoculi M165/69 TaxID=743966 RepID=W5USI4_9BACT|nr:hypothetical protein [Mesomycoplasma bovoculi]AHH45179.1 putative lipoprotein [Mesomycoplasma bovoculi M165/69]
MKIKKILSSLTLLLIPISVVSCFPLKASENKLKKEDLTKNNYGNNEEQYTKFMEELFGFLDKYELDNNFSNNVYWPNHLIENRFWAPDDGDDYEPRTWKDLFKLSNIRDFQQFIANPINNKEKHLSLDSLQKLFELSFLNGEKLNDVLKTVDLYVYQLIDSPYEYKKYKTLPIYIKKQSNVIYINHIWQGVIKEHFKYLVPGHPSNGQYPYYWKIVRVPKNKQVKIKRIDQFEKIQEIKDELASKYNNSDNQLFYNFLTQKNEKIFDFFVKNQTKNKIIAKSPWFLNKLASSSLISYDKPFLENYTTQITNPSDFQSFVNKVRNLDSSQTSRQISFNFRKSFLNGQTLDRVLKNNNIFILETWKPMYFSDWLLVKKQDNNNIYLTTAKTSDFEFEEQLQDHFSFDKVGFQAIVVPKTQKITFNYKTNFKELNQDFIKQESEN